MDLIVENMPPEHAATARALQEALMEMLGETDEEEGEEGGSTCEPCTPAEPTEQERTATAYFEEVREVVGWSMEGAPPSPPLAALRASHNGCAGGLLLTRFELLWIAAGSHFSEAKLRVPLRQIEHAGASLSKSPFGNRAELIIMRQGDLLPVRLACGSALADVEMFSLELATAVGAILGASAATEVASAAASTSAAPPANPAAVPRQTKQKLAAADLRQKLKQVVALQRSHEAESNEGAAAILSELKAGEGKAPSIHTIYKHSEHLREVALGFGGYALSKRVIEQFIQMPAVQLLLPDLLREQQSDSADAHVAKELMASAKAFFKEIFGVGLRGGRLSDKDRNAFAAASAALLP